MSYLKLNSHKINYTEAFKYIKESQDERIKFWLNYGLSKEDIECLVDMESNERPCPSPQRFYISRKYLLMHNKIGIDDVKKDIDEYKMRG